MSVYVWGQAMEPDFPLAVLEYRTGQGEDRMHWHDHLEVALVLEGRGTFRFGRDELPAEPGDVFFINDALPHVALPEPGGALRLLLVLFRPELLAGPGCRDLDLGYLAPFRSDDAALARVPAASPLAMALEPVLGELLEVAERHDPAERHLLDATLRRALALAVRERC
ncbi:MAG TPA: AraC family ligand binding domain-containing protein, partial [Candidatus Limnocylindrales bacterium]